MISSPTFRPGFRDGKFDVALLAGPRVDEWPSAGVRALSTICAEMGLSVGVFGGETLRVRGVLPLPGTGGLILIEDVQNRIHRIHSRAVVKVSRASTLPDPFAGWLSQGLIPLSTALKLRKAGKISWNPCTVILGTGNPALRFGSALLESGVSEVYCIESQAHWQAKRFEGWEVERRHFEMAGGRLIEASPVQLSEKAPLLWELRLQDAQGVRVLEIARAVSAGPFRDLPGIREYPPGSFLFELDQTAANTPSEDVEGWVLEEERGRWLGCKIIKALVSDLGSQREEVERIYKKAKMRLKRYSGHKANPFTPSFQGKWVAPSDAKRIRAFSGVPQSVQKSRLVASIECFEEIPCNLCQRACPENAIHIGKVPRPATQDILIETKCTACGACLPACPSGSTLMLRDQEDRSTSQLVLAWRGVEPWKPGEFATLLSRKGEAMGSARVTVVSEISSIQTVQLEVPSYLIWEARAIKRARPTSSMDQDFLASIERSWSGDEKVEILMNGEKRLVRDKIPVSLALFEMGQSQPSDILFCSDGNCNLCRIKVDGVTKLACQTLTHRGMSVLLTSEKSSLPLQDQSYLCPCLGVTRESVIERMTQGKLQSPEAVLSVTHVGQGRCHGQLCMEAFRRVLLDQGLDASQWVDWRFPWSEWSLIHN